MGNKKKSLSKLSSCRKRSSKALNEVMRKRRSMTTNQNLEQGANEILRVNAPTTDISEVSMQHDQTTIRLQAQKRAQLLESTNADDEKIKEVQPPNSEPPQTRLESIFLFQSQNPKDPKESAAVKIKREYPINLEPSTNKPDLDLDVEYDSKADIQLQNLVINNIVTEQISEAGISGNKRSARLMMKEVENQAKILLDIQVHNKRKEKMAEETQEDINTVSEGEKLNQIPKEEVDENVIYLPNNKQIEYQEFDIKQEMEQEETPNEESDLTVEEKESPNPLEISNTTVNNDQNQEVKVQDNQGLLVELESRSVELEEVKRKRGRPRKTIVIDSIPVTEKRKRGRPRKHKLDDTKKVDSVKRQRGRPPKPRDDYGNIIVDEPRAPGEEQDEESEGEYTVFISEEVMEDPIHLDIQGVINFLV